VGGGEHPVTVLGVPDQGDQHRVSAVRGGRRIDLLVTRPSPAA
jgi:hypothetical protein